MDGTFFLLNNIDRVFTQAVICLEGAPVCPVFPPPMPFNFSICIDHLNIICILPEMMLKFKKGCGKQTFPATGVMT